MERKFAESSFFNFQIIHGITYHQVKRSTPGAGFADALSEKYQGREREKTKKRGCLK